MLLFSRPRGSSLFCPIVLVATIFSRPVAADELARWLPADTPLIVELARPAALQPLLENWNLLPILRDLPQVRSALENPDLGNVRLAVEAVAASLNTTPLALADELAGAGATLAVEGPQKYVLVVRPNRPDRLQPALDAALKLVRQELAKQNLPDSYVTQEHQGVSITSFAQTGALAIVDHQLLVTNSLDRLKALLDLRANPPAESLAGDARFAKLKGSLADNAAAWFYARLDKVRAFNASPEAAKPGDETGGRLLLGRWLDLVQKGETLGGQLIVQADSLELKALMSVPADVQNGPLEVFRPHTVGASLPIQIPQTLLSATLWRDFSAMWEVREQFLGPEALKGLAQLDSFAGQFFGGRDFGTGVLGSLGDQWRIVIAHQDYDAQKPAPGTRYPGVALIIPVDPEDEEFGVRLQSAFQTFIGLANLGAAQSKSPPLMLGSEQVEGVTMFRGTFVPPKNAVKDEPADDRFNLSPSGALVGNAFVLASSADVARTVIRSLKNPSPTQAEPTDQTKAEAIPTLRIAASGPEIAKLVAINKETLVSRNVLEKGNSRQAAAGEIELLEKLLAIVKTAHAEILDAPDEVRLNFHLDRANAPTK